jgi:hypothetical protein
MLSYGELNGFAPAPVVSKMNRTVQQERKNI